MRLKNTIFSSESVTEGHPDKMADQISDAILDEMLRSDPDARVACETFVTTGMVVVGGEITTSCYVDIPDVVRQTVKDIGYSDNSMGFDYKTCAVITSIDKQSPDIAMGVNKEDQGAGDQGIMFGFATNETDTYMPMPIHLSHLLAERLAYVRKQNILDYLRPDGKTQVSVHYENGKPKRVTSIIVSSQHADHVNQDDIRKGILKEIIHHEVDPSNDYKTYINPTGRFVIGGPQGDCGLTGRKIIVDTYGGMGRHGGGAFSGKDPSKVDRSAAYMARHIAKNIVAAGLSDRAEIQLSYAIGVADPISILVETFGTEHVDPVKIEKAVREVFPLKPAGIINYLDLKKPIYRKTAAYGHFGRNLSEFTWEKLNKVNELKTLL